MIRILTAAFCAIMMIVISASSVAGQDLPEPPEIAELNDCIMMHVDGNMSAYHNTFVNKFNQIDAVVQAQGPDALRAYMESLREELRAAEESMRAALTEWCRSMYRAIHEFDDTPTKQAEIEEDYVQFLFNFVQTLYGKWDTFLTLEAQAPNPIWRVFRFRAAILHFDACKEKFLDAVKTKELRWIKG